MHPWDRLLSILVQIHGSHLRYYELDEPLQSVLETLAIQEQRPTKEVQADLIEAGLAQRHTHDEFWQHWQSLSPREQQVTAYTCLGYTNRQMAARMGVTEETVKTHVRNALVKFNLHGKSELRMALEEWDFSEWGPRAGETVIGAMKHLL